jgi:formate hydrogenlyase subunit 4
MNILILVLNLALAVSIAPILDGVRRKLTARLQNRIGPPILQTWYDLLKLFRKETLVPETGGFLALIIPVTAFTVSLSMFAIVPTITIDPPIEGGIIVFIHLAVLSAFLLAIAGSASGNPYGIVGGSREVILATVIEPSIIISLINLAVLGKSMSFEKIVQNTQNSYLYLWLAAALIIYFLCIIAESGRVPFDIPEAESELTGGPTVEFSGKLLAFIKFGELIRVVALFSVAKFFINAFIPPNIIGGELSFVPPLLYFLTIIICTIVVSLAESLNARFRLVEATKLSGYLLVISSIILIVSLITGG